MKIGLCLLLALAMLTGVCHADGEDVLSAQSEALELDELERAAGEYGDGLDIGSISLDEGLLNLLDTGSDQVFGVLKKAVRSCAMLLFVVLLCGLADGAGSISGGKTPQGTALVCALAVSAIAVTDVNSLMGMGREAIDSMEAFSKVLLPTMAAASAAGGSPTGATVRQMATILFSDVLMTLINRVLLSLVYAYIAACTAYAAIGNEGLKRLASTLKWAVTSILTTVLLVFVGYLTISGVISGATDAVTIKAAKFTMSSMVPVVGGILSDAAETVLAGAGILRNAVGIFGMLVILGICLLPFLQLGIHYLAYKATAALAATVADSRASALIDGIGGAFGLVLGMTGSCAILMLVSVVSGISVVSG